MMPQYTYCPPQQPQQYQNMIAQQHQLNNFYNYQQQSASSIKAAAHQPAVQYVPVSYQPTFIIQGGDINAGINSIVNRNKEILKQMLVF